MFTKLIGRLKTIYQKLSYTGVIALLLLSITVLVVVRLFLIPAPTQSPRTPDGLPSFNDRDIPTDNEGNIEENLVFTGEEYSAAEFEQRLPFVGEFYSIELLNEQYYVYFNGEIAAAADLARAYLRANGIDPSSDKIVYQAYFN